MASTTLAPGETESEHFSPYRADGKLHGFVCVVIGATHPIGRAIVAELATHGAASIYACTLPSAPPATPAQDPSATDSTTASSGATVIPYPYLPSEESTLQLIDDVLNAHGRLDVWATVATVTGPATLASTSPAALGRLVETNALLPFYALKYGPPAMQKTCTRGGYHNAAPKDRKYGSIIIVGESEGRGVGAAMAAQAALGVVKAGVKELRGTGVRINAISHAGVDDGGVGGGSEVVNGLGRAGRADEVARVAGFLASGFSSYVTGANMVVDGGAAAV